MFTYHLISTQFDTLVLEDMYKSERYKRVFVDYSPNNELVQFDKVMTTHLSNGPDPDIRTSSLNQLAAQSS